MSQGEERNQEGAIKNWAFSEPLDFKSISKERWWLQAIICEIFVLFGFLQGLQDILKLNSIFCGEG